MSKKRGLLVWSLFGLATILMFVSSLTVWAKRQLLDDQAWANSSTQLLANDEVRGAIAQKLSDGLFQRADVEAQLRERLPEAAWGRDPCRHDRHRHRGAAPANAAGVPGGSAPGACDVWWPWATGIQVRQLSRPAKKEE